MAKRVNGEGSIVKRKDGSFMGALVIGRKPDGNLDRKYIYGKNKTEVAQRLQEMAVKAKDSINTPESMTLETWISFWLESFKKLKLKPKTYLNYNILAERHVYPVLGRILLKYLNTLQVQQFVNELSRSMASGSVRKVFQVLNCALNKAVNNDLIPKNPCKGVELPSLTQKIVKALTIEEEQSFLQAAKQNRMYPLFLVAIDSGLRLGELLALKWSDVDLESGELSVNKNLVCVPDSGKYKLTIGTPKTRTSNRKVPLTVRSIQTLKELRSKASSITVFVTKTLNYYHPQSVDRTFKLIARKAGLDGFSFHSLRHAYATRLFELGIPVITVSKLLGHASTKMTLDIYTSVQPKLKTEAVKALDLLHCSQN